MEYKGYFGSVTFDSENDVFHGEVIGIRDVITFQGKSVVELRRAFRDSVNDYLAFCQERGESPDKPLSGRFVLRIPPELHRKVHTLASKAGQSLNSWIAARLENEVEHALSRTAGAKQSRDVKRAKRGERTTTTRKQRALRASQAER
jgi:predicted HicB family RNase H-like nuclease